MVFRIGLAAVISVLASWLWADEQRYTFTWKGAGGYVMQGALSYDAAGLNGPLVLRDDVLCFEIAGTLEDAPIGAWGLADLTPETSWRLHFSHVHSRFVTEGFFITMPQAWNMNGAGTDCGQDGFGFNLGNIGQDLCISNIMIEDSRVSPYRAFPATRDDDHVFGPGACRDAQMLSALR